MDRGDNHAGDRMDALCATDKLTGSAVHLIITFSQRKCLYQQRTFTPTAACTVIVVVGIPVIYVFSEFTGEDALFRFVLLFVITRPAVDYIVMFLYTGRMHIGSGYRTSGYGYSSFVISSAFSAKSSG